MAVFKYLNPNYVEGGSEPKWIKIPLTGSAVITPVQSTGQSEVDIMSQKAVTDALNTKQNTLVSGTNIKTINGQTLLGNGDVDMSEFATQEDVADINQTIDSLGDTYATKDDLSGYLPLNGGGIIDTSNYELDLTGNGLEIMSTSTGSNAKYSIGGIQITEHQEDGDGVSTISIETNYVKGGSLNIEGTEYKKEGVTISNKTTSDLLNAGGSTTSISDITTQVQAAIVDSAPETLDTLNELAAALGDDPNFATTVTNKIAAKQDKLVSGTNIKTINGQSLLGSGNISLLSNPVSGTLTVGGTTSNVPTINIKRDDTPHPAIILNEGGLGGLASITFQHAGTGELGTTINRNGVTIAGKSSSDLLTAAGSTTSLKTINNQSLLGSGNITIEGGASGDYLPLSGGTLTGNVNMTGDNPIFKLTGENGYSITLQPEGENSDPSITIESSDGAPKVQVITSEGKSKLTGTKLVFSDNLDNVKSTFADRYIKIGDRSDEFIYVSSSGIEKNGGNNTTVFTTDGGTASLGNYATTASVSQAVSDATFNNGHNAVSSVAGIPVSKRLVIATISNNGSFTLASTPADGREIHVIVHNTSSSDIEITMPSGSNYVKMSGDTLTVAGNSYADINVISDGTNMYIRAL